MLQIHWHSKTWFKLRFECSLEEYKKYKLGELVENIVAGATPKTSVDDYWNGGDIPWLSSGEVHKKFIYFTDKFITSEGYNNSSTKIVPTNSVLIALAGQGKTRGTVAINKIELCTNQSIASIIPNEMLNYKYLFYYLESKYEYLRALSSSDGGRGGLNLKLIRSIPIQVPSIKEQENISNFINEIDKKILLLEQKHKLYDDFKKYLMQQIFTQKLRFNFNDAWKTVKIKDIFDERSEKGFLDLELLSVTLNDGVIKRSEIESKDNSNENKSNYKHVLPGDIVYNSMRMWQGASGVSPYEGIVSPAYTILIPKNVYSKYFGYYFKTNEMVYQFKKYSQGLTSDTWNLKYPLISEIKIKIPSIEEQKEITNVFEIMDEKIKILQNNIDELTTFKKGLLQQMFV